MKKLYSVLCLILLATAGLTAQVIQITDINTAGGSSILNPFLFKGAIYFEADDGSTIADELYVIKADGTVALVKNINADPDDTTPNSDPGEFIEYKGKLYFKANDGDNTMNDVELWVSDGTEAGTMMVYDIQPGINKGSNPQHMFVFNGKLYFQANDGSSTQFWGYDGVNDPVKVTNLKSGLYATPSYPIVDEANSRVFFQAFDDAVKFQLHVMKADETVDIITITTTTGGYVGNEAILFNGKLYFRGNEGTNGNELWVSDGTQAGTSMLKDINPGASASSPGSFSIYNNKLYFVADPGTGKQLWVTDGTEAGTTMAAAPYPAGNANISNLKVYKNKLFFQATDGVNGAELWAFDGTTAAMFKDIVAGSGSSSPAGFIEVSGLLFFEINTGTKVLCVTDGTAENTKIVNDIFKSGEKPTAINSGEFIANGYYLYFTGTNDSGEEFFRVDASQIFPKPLQVTDINPNGSSVIINPFVYNGEVYFEADPKGGTTAGNTDDELYVIRSNGNVELVKNINDDPDDTTPNSDPGNFTVYNGKLYFKANNGDNTKEDIELWVTDGTEAGTQMVYDIYPGVTKGSNPQHLFVFNGKLYFQANDGTSTQWWGYDGNNDPVKVTNLKSGLFATPQNPVVDEANSRVFFEALDDALKFQLHVMKADETVDIITITTTTGGYVGSQAILFNGKLYFRGNEGTNGNELWVSDGTQAGTYMLKDIFPGSSNSSPGSFVVYNNKLYFSASEDANGQKLWVTDGTPEGTVVAATPNPTGTASIFSPKVYNGKLYFQANDGVNGSELWVFDGTTASMLKDIRTTGTPSNAAPNGFTIVDGLLFFAASDGTDDFLYVTDGTTERTMQVASALNSSVNPGSVNYGEIVSVGTKVYYTGIVDGTTGEEFYMVNAKEIFVHDVTFNVTDGVLPISGASITFNGTTKTTDAAGVVVFDYVRPSDNLAFIVSKTGYGDETGSLVVGNADVVENITMSPATYSVEFKVMNGTGPLAGASVTFQSTTLTTDGTGSATFTGITPGTSLPFTVTLTDYADYNGTTDVDGDEIVNVMMVATSITDAGIIEVKVYPNPTKGAITIDGDVIGARYTIFDSGMRVVKNGVINSNSMTLNLRKGLYLLVIEKDLQKITTRIIIQ